MEDIMNTIYSLFQSIVTENKEKTAIIENDRTMTFDELSNLVDLIAGSFPKEVTSVGIVMSHRAEMIAAILAVLKCGARYVPAEPSFPTGRIHYMMKEAKVDFILTEMSFSDKLKGFEIRLTDCEICGCIHICSQSLRIRFRNTSFKKNCCIKSRTSGLRSLYIGYNRTPKGNLCDKP